MALAVTRKAAQRFAFGRPHAAFALSASPLGHNATSSSFSESPAVVPGATSPSVPADGSFAEASPPVAGRTSTGTSSGHPLQHELYNRHRSVMPLDWQTPFISVNTFVAPNATVIGDVEIQEKVSVWYGAVLRGDLNFIRIGFCSSIGEGTVIHADSTSPTGLSAETVIGRYVTIGAKSVLRSCQLDGFNVIGQRCVVLEGSVLEGYSVLGEGSVVPAGSRIPAKQLWAGNPVRFVRQLTSDDIEEIQSLAEEQYALSQEHASEILPYSTAYIEAEALKKKMNKKADLSVLDEKLRRIAQTY